MPLKQTKARAKKARKQGKAPTTQAGEFVREQMHKMKRGKGAAKNPKQAVAIGLSEARREGVAVPKKKAAKKTSKKSAKKAPKKTARRRR
jgi:hypothetical protein